MSTPGHVVTEADSRDILAHFRKLRLFPPSGNSRGSGGVGAILNTNIGKMWWAVVQRPILSNKELVPEFASVCVSVSYFENWLPHVN